MNNSLSFLNLSMMIVVFASSYLFLVYVLLTWLPLWLKKCSPRKINDIPTGGEVLNL